MLEPSHRLPQAKANAVSRIPVSDTLKRAAAERAAQLVTDGMRLGLGTGSTAAHFVAAIGERVRGGLKVVGVPTSEATREQAQREGIPLTTLDRKEHTSELQSRQYLVCRLLLEKKKKKNVSYNTK